MTFSSLPLKRLSVSWLITFACVYAINFGLFVFSTVNSHFIFNWLLDLSTPFLFFLGSFLCFKTIGDRWVLWFWVGISWWFVSILLSAALMPFVYGVPSSFGLSSAVWIGNINSIAAVISGGYVRDRVKARAANKTLLERSEGA